ncbi:hypothetical protein BDZ91DRAFT_716743 [Kalaharituber pfeilii]|nr:hypothetical protein BDZ91DRAFT_716743 [Kalaharituber pfeilii]
MQSSTLQRNAYLQEVYFFSKPAASFGRSTLLIVLTFWVGWLSAIAEGIDSDTDSS